MSDRPVDTYGFVAKGGTQVLTRRVLATADGAALQQADVTSISLTVYALSDDDPTTRTEVLAATAVSKTDAIFDTLQKDEFWNNDQGEQKDSTGYNFRHEPPALDDADDVFNTPGLPYLCEYTITPSASGARPIKVRFVLRCV